METQELHRGRLIDHLQLVVKDLAASKRFYTAVFKVLEIPLAGEGDDFFWADELFISTKESAAAQGELTGRTHLAFQGKSRQTVEQFYKAALAAGGRDNGAPGERPYHPGYLRRFRHRSGWKQYRGGVSRTGEEVCGVGEDHLRQLMTKLIIALILVAALLVMGLVGLLRGRRDPMGSPEVLERAKQRNRELEAQEKREDER